MDLTTPFQPCAIYYPDSDRFEILFRDAATVTEQEPGADVYILRDMTTREIVGMGVAFASEVLASDFQRKAAEAY